MMRVALILAAVLQAVGVWGATTYVYEEACGDKRSEKRWTFDTQANAVIVKGRSDSSQFEILCDVSYQFERYRYENLSRSAGFECQRFGDHLLLEKIPSKEDPQSYPLDGRAWIQEFGVGLRSFALSSESTYRFSILYPKDFTLHPMIAKKEGNEPLELFGKSYAATKISITLPGFKGKFWKAYIWFEEKTGVFLRYRGNEGPRTKDTIISLKSVEESILSEKNAP